MNNPSQFITTEPLDSRGEKGEQLVWDGIQTAFRDRNCLAYWRYPIFSKKAKFRQEPDILIADFLLGLIVIEVKAIKIEQIVNIQGHRWEYQNFYTNYGNPYQQAENQLFALLEYSDREPLLHKNITAKAIVALPYITEQQWQVKGFNKLPNSPPILFKDHLDSPKLIYQFVAETTPIISGDLLTPTQWELFLAVLGGTPLYTQPFRRIATSNQSRRQIIQQVRSRLNQLDLQQEKIAKQIPPGMQRIRGIAGSGKTVLLCQKAAIMHVKYPEWRIALVFFSRSLYDSITQQVDKWIRHLTKDEQTYNPQESNLKILHAWGSRKQPGFYSTLCKLTGIPASTVSYTTSRKPNEALAEVCLQLLETTAIPQIFDAVLIDEGQDLIVDRWKYQDKQPFYWLVYQSLRPVDPIYPQQRRLIWTYDELQSLDSLNIPDPCELFGEELGHLVTGQYSNNINKTEIISRCYRTPHQIIITAHAIAMGLLRKEGILTGSIYPEEWQAMGYEVTGNWQPGSQITLKRQHQNSPNLISELWQGDIINFNQFSSRQQELTTLADNIKHNLQPDNLQPDREILIIVLGSFHDTTPLIQQVAIFLINQGINIYLPTNNSYNLLQTEPEKRQPNQFWCEGAVTISAIHRAKGQEADMVYLIGLDNIAKDESNLYLRNQLFVALTRTRGWVNISGISDYSLYKELSQIIASNNTIKFTFTGLPQREIRISDRADLLQGFALGRTNFRNANLHGVDLSTMNLENINLIEADLSNANLQGANLTKAKLIAANLSNANLSHANLTNAKLIGANLTDTNLTNTKLTNANLTNAILSRSS
jgi:superfamily I DNA and RNA helicase